MDPGDWIAVGSTAVAVIAAGVSVRQAKHAKSQVEAAEEQVVVARRQLEHAEKVHREQNEPYVVVDIQPQAPASSVLIVIVENIGSTIARNVQITVDPPIRSGWGDDVTELLQRGLSHTFPMLPPRRRLEFLLDEQERFQNTDLPTAYTFTVRCEGPYGPVEQMEYVVDFGTYAETLLTQHPLKGVEGRLSNIHRELKSLAAAYKKSHASDIREESQRILRALRERREQTQPDGLPNSGVEAQERGDEAGEANPPARA